MIATLGLGLTAALILLVAVELVSGGRLRVFGPVLFFDAVRSGRRGRFFLARVGYAVALFLLLMYVYLIWVDDYRGSRNAARDLAALGETYFFSFIILQFVAVCLLTPGYVAGAIADEKERRTLDFLLATDLANREIVFGKAAARVGNLILFLITGLPVLSLIQFFGGIDPAILFLSFAATGLTALGLVGISLVQSVQRRRVRDAVLMTFLVAFGYLAVSWVFWLVVNVLYQLPGPAGAPAVATLQSAVDVFRWGDPVRALTIVAGVIGGAAASRRDAYLQLLGEYATFHVVVFLAGVIYSVWRVRRIALRQSGGGENAVRRRVRARRRPPVSADRPMVWKESWIESSMRLGPWARIGLTALILLGFVPLLMGIYYLFTSGRGASANELQDMIGAWVRFMNVVLGTFIIIGAGVRAAGAVGAERDHDTLTSLLTSPLTAAEILGGKWWGAVFGMRTLALWLAFAWAIGIVTGSVSVLGVPIAPVAIALPAAAAACAGLLFSVNCRTTLRALIWTLVALLFGMGGHWLLVSLCCYLPIGLIGLGRDFGYLIAYHVGLTPPVVFGFIPFGPEEHWFLERDAPVYVILCGLGVLTWAAVGLAFWFAAVDRFAHATNRAGPIAPDVAT
jgi:ABC-type transport system involved in multi-copper enzyme maturation permease subunit